MSVETEFEKMSGFEPQQESTSTSIKEKIGRKIEQGKHIILYGPPGTGKTRLISALLVEQEKIGHSEFIQFHPQYSYQDFVEGYSVKEGQFDYKPGVFLKFIESIQDSASDARNLLIIDEINRADISSVFGELMTLLDDPINKKIQLPLSGEVLETNSYFTIVGTMNSADKNIAIMDFALRRRFDFIFVPPDYDGMREWLATQGMEIEEFTADQYVEFARRLNARIVSHPILGKNMTIGQALFVPQKKPGEPIEIEDICETLADKVIPQIEAYLGTGNSSDLASILSPDLMSKVQQGSEIKALDIINLIHSIAPNTEE